MTDKLTDSTTVIERDVDIDKETKRPRRWQVIVLNDDFTPMEFVVGVLMQYFDKSIAEATRIMMDVHEKGRGLAGIYTFEVAETKVSAVSGVARHNEFPLRLFVEPAPISE